MATIRGTSRRDVLRDGSASNTLLGFAGNDDLYGNGGNDTLRGGTGKDKLVGGKGNDKLFGDSGNDTLDGGVGNDTLDGGIGDDVMKGGAGNDTFVVNSLADVTTDTGGIDLVKSSVSRTLATGFESLTLTGAAAINGTGNSGDNALTGNGAANTLDGAGGTDTLNGLGGDDILVVGTGASTYNGGDGTGDVLSFRNGTAGPGDLNFGLDASGNATSLDFTDFNLGTITYSGIEGLEGRNLAGARDILIGNASNNILRGLDGDDIFEGRGGDDTIEGGNGHDTLSYYNHASGVTVTLGAGGSGTANLIAAGLGTDTYSSIEELHGSNIGGDTLTGNNLADTIYGFGGADTLDGGSGGADTLNGGDGDDILKVGGIGGSTDTLNGDNNTDTISLEAAGNGLFGGSTLTFTLGAGGSGSFNGTAFNVDSANYTGIENVTGRNNATFGDTLTGNAANNVLNGLAGADTLEGKGGSDTLNGGAGNDTLIVDAFTSLSDVDQLNGGDDVDTLSFIRASDGTLGPTVWTFTLDSSGAGSITTNFVDLAFTSFTGIENLTGRDTATSGATDTLTGNNTANVLSGLAGNDSLYGAGGTDTLIGGLGGDILDGGTGADTFVYATTSESISSNYDRIENFNRTEGDKVDIRGFANENPNDIIWLGQSAFTGNGDAEMNWESFGISNQHALVYVDLNGDTTVDFMLFFFNPTSSTMQQSDFLAFFQ